MSRCRGVQAGFPPRENRRPGHLLIFGSRIPPSIRNQKRGDIIWRESRSSTIPRIAVLNGVAGVYAPASEAGPVECAEVSLP